MMKQYSENEIIFICILRIFKKPYDTKEISKLIFDVKNNYYELEFCLIDNISINIKWGKDFEIEIITEHFLWFKKNIKLTEYKNNFVEFQNLPEFLYFENAYETLLQYRGFIEKEFMDKATRENWTWEDGVAK